MKVNPTPASQFAELLQRIDAAAIRSPGDAHQSEDFALRRLDFRNSFLGIADGDSSVDVGRKFRERARPEPCLTQGLVKRVVHQIRTNNRRASIAMGTKGFSSAF